LLQTRGNPEKCLKLFFVVEGQKSSADGKSLNIRADAFMNLPFAEQINISISA
jgi:hypothetical protein